MNQLNRRKFVLSSVAAAALTGAAASARQATPVASPVATLAPGSLQARLVDFVILPDEQYVDDTLLGGLSGIDYDPVADVWYFISDDRTGVYPPRFYTGSISYDDNGFTDVSFNTAVALLQEDGSPFPGWEEGGLVPDPEAIRVDPQSSQLWWTSEGAYELDLDPFVAVSNPDGSLVSMTVFPAPFATESPDERGVRDNHNFEGLSFSTDGETLWIGLEHPLFQDGQIPSPESNAFVRLINIDRSGAILREYAVEIDAINIPEGAQYFTRGMSEILVLDDNRILAIDRVTIADKDWQFENYIRLLELDITNATDIHGIESLENTAFEPVARRLVIDLNDAGLMPIDNLEGMAFGPNLPNGNRALVLVNDNNFDTETQVGQVVLLELIEN